jgi:hemerythrin superfamily protein
MPRQKTKSRAAEKDAISLLKADHAKVRELLSELAETTPRGASKRKELLSTIEAQLKTHTKIEEDIFYPAFRDAAEKQDEKKLYYEALEEHHVVDMVLAEIKDADAASEEFAAKAKVLKDLVEHHAEEEESEMFPKAKKLMDRDELMSLGERLAKGKESASGGVIGKLIGMR